MGPEAEDNDDEEEAEEEKKQDRIFRPKMESFQFDHTGPFEPLVLSLPGEISVFQVICGYPRMLKHFILAFSFSVSMISIFIAFIECDEDQNLACSPGERFLSFFE